MPTDLRLSLTLDDIVSSWGHHTRLTSSRGRAMLSELLARIETNGWVEPKINFKVYPVVSSGPGWIELPGRSRLFSTALRHHLPGALYVAAGVCTIGAALEQQVSNWFAAGDRLRAVLLDEIGTLAVFRLGDQLEERIQAEARERGMDASGVLSPGEDGFDISQQAPILELACGAEIGVWQTATGMLIPRKSVSVLVGFGTHMPHWSRAERCARCGARERCPHRRPQMIEVAK